MAGLVAGLVVEVPDGFVSAAFELSAAFAVTDEGAEAATAVEVVKRPREECLSELRGQVGL